jgi:hypothetical protein
MYRLAISSVAAMLLSAAVPTANAVSYTYNVDIAGFTDPNLSVVGTITYDTSLQSITTSSLSIYDPTSIIQTLSTPFTNSNPAAYQFIATPTALYFVDSLSPNELAGGINWENPGLAVVFSLQAVTPDVVTVEAYGTGSNIQILPGGGLPGFLVGTAATPEPSSYVLAITALVLAGGFTALRKRFGKSPV